jgi:hypothetical protein
MANGKESAPSEGLVRHMTPSEATGMGQAARSWCGPMRISFRLREARNKKNPYLNPQIIL